MKENKSRKRFRVRHFLIFAIIVYLGITFFNQQKIIKALENEKIQKQDEIEKLNGEIKDIEEKLKYTDSLEYIEKMAREELKMVMPDEIIYIDTNKSKEDKSNEGIDN
ncbi:septum formation initiator family protein [Proteiniborus sp.]|uniref:FtsB family cell division protein n=1 Tax=Proteiniborus sp. TaxID=2079015 RepID=UPI003321A471